MTDQLATLREAEAAGATIQAYTLIRPFKDDGSTPLDKCRGAGRWRDLEGPVEWSCHPTRYRVKVEDAA